VDLVTGARRVIVAMTHRSPEGSKIVRCCTLPITGTRCVDLVVTDLAVIRPMQRKLVLVETAEGVSVEDVSGATMRDSKSIRHCCGERIGEAAQSLSESLYSEAIDPSLSFAAIA
jgi:acyl CoA:acetate/3-ketoacid CoA transferase beta subunit